MTPTVLHVVDVFVGRSEFFIYSAVTGHRRYRAEVVCRERQLETEYPLESVHVIDRPITKRDPRWWVARARESCTGEAPWHRRVLDIVRRVRPAVIHAHFGPNGCLMVPVVQRTGIPLVTSFYGVDISVLPRLPHWRLQYQRLFAAGSLFLGEGPEMLRKIAAAGAPVSRIALHHITVPVGAYPRWRPASGPPTALFVGRFVEKKGLLDAIRAVGRARARVAGLGLRVIGDGPDMSAAREEVSRLGLDAAVTFLGSQPHAVVVSELASSHLLVHPSATARDGDSEGGAPTVLLEAQVIGTPLVTTEHADIPYVVAEGPAARLCAEHDIAALQEAIVAVLAYGGSSSDRVVRAHHDPVIETARLEAQYDRLTDADSAAGCRAAAR